MKKLSGKRCKNLVEEIQITLHSKSQFYKEIREKEVGNNEC
jgi:hypothetical protein